MNLDSTIQMTREEAHAIYLKYRGHKAYSTPHDAEIARIAKHVAAGRVVIRALDEIIKAGLGEDGLPKLALAPADARACFLSISTDGTASMSATENPSRLRGLSNRHFEFPRGSFVGVKTWRRAQAMMPLIPPEHRPKRGLANYHVLWEAVWNPAPPVDPLLLRRVGKSDLWLVLAAWELTELERAVLGSHLLLGRRN